MFVNGASLWLVVVYTYCFILIFVLTVQVMWTGNPKLIFNKKITSLFKNIYMSFFDITSPLEIREIRCQMLKLETLKLFSFFILSSAYKLLSLGSMVYIFSAFPKTFRLSVMLLLAFLILDILFKRTPVVIISLREFIDEESKTKS